MSTRNPVEIVTPDKSTTTHSNRIGSDWERVRKKSGVPSWAIKGTYTSIPYDGHLHCEALGVRESLARANIISVKMRNALQTSSGEILSTV